MTYRVDIFEHEDPDTYKWYANTVRARKSEHYKRVDMLYSASDAVRDMQGQYENEALDLIAKYGYVGLNSGNRVEFEDMVYYNILIYPPGRLGVRLIICLFPDEVTAVHWRLTVE